MATQPTKKSLRSQSSSLVFVSVFELPNLRHANTPTIADRVPMIRRMLNQRVFFMVAKGEGDGVYRSE